MIDKFACECAGWCRDGIDPYGQKLGLTKYITNHHKNCPHYEDSLVDVMIITYEGQRMFFIDRVAALIEVEQINKEDPGADVECKVVKMHYEVYENMEEHQGW